MPFFANAVRLLIGHVLVTLHGLLLAPFIVKLSGAETFGAFSLVTSLLGFVFGISSFGVGFRAKRYLPSADGPARRSALFWPQFWFQAFFLATLAVPLAFFLPQLSDLVGAHSHSVRIGFVGVVTFLGGYFLYAQATDYFRYVHRPDIYNVATVVFPYLYVALAAASYFLTRELDLPMLVMAQAIAAAAVGLYLALRIWREIGLTAPVFDVASLRADIALGFPLTMSYVVDVVLAAGSRFVLGGILSVLEVGYFVPAYTLGMVIILLPRVAGILLPTLLAKAIDDQDQATGERLVEVVSRLFIALAIPFTVGALVLGYPLLEIYTNAEIAASAWLVVPIVAVSGVFYGLTLILGNVLTVCLRTGALLRANSIAAVLNLGLNITLLPIYKSLVVPALAGLVSYLIAYVLVLGSLRGVWLVRIDPAFILRVLAASAVMGGVAFWIFQALAANVAEFYAATVTLVAAVLCYSAAAVVLRVVDRAELNLVLGRLRGRLVPHGE